MGIPGILVWPVGEDNVEPSVRFLTEWVSDGEAEARMYLADHEEPEGASLSAVGGSGVIGYLAIVWSPTMPDSGPAATRWFIRSR